MVGTGIVFLIIGALVGWFGIWVYRAGKQPGVVETVKISGGIFIFLAVCLIGAGIFFFTFPSSESGTSSSHKCCICGKPGGRQITNSAGDTNYYCTEHYADAWQYYYGN